MNEKISLKYIFKLLLENKKPLIFGQIITIFAILISIPIPLLLPLLVDEVLLEKPAFIVNNLKDLGIDMEKDELINTLPMMSSDIEDFDDEEIKVCRDCMKEV